MKEVQTPEHDTKRGAHGGLSDVICEFPLREMLAFHKQRQAEGTILVTQVRNSLPAAQATHSPHRQCKRS